MYTKEGQAVIYIKEGTPEEVAEKLSDFIEAAFDGSLEAWVVDEHGNRGRLRDNRRGDDLGPSEVRIEAIPQGIAIVIGSRKEDPDPMKKVIARAQVPGKEAVKLILVDSNVAEYEFDLPESEEGGGRANPHEIENLAICLPIIIEAKVKTLANIMYGQRWDT